MNILEMLRCEIADKSWSLEEKARYIYIRSCELFSYDPRYKLCLWINNGAKLEQEIYNRKIDLTNVQDFNVVCSSYSNYVISVLLSELLGIKCEVKEDIMHYHVMIYIGDKVIKINSTWSDICRIKMGLDTRDYELALGDNTNLEEIDKRIGYKYQNQIIISKRNDLDELSKIKTINDDEALMYRIATIKEMYETFKANKNFSDARFCIEYLKRKLLPLANRRQIVDNTFFKENNNDNWEIMRLYAVYLNQDIACFALRNTNGTYSFDEISQDEAKYYSRVLTSENRKTIF